MGYIKLHKNEVCKFARYMIIDILNFMVAVATVFLAYRFFIERSKGKKIAEMKVLMYSLISCFVLLWIINIFIGFVK